MALVLGDRPVRPLTAEEVMRMVEAGILGEDEPVELLHGVLTAVSAKSPQHVEIKMRLFRRLAASDQHEVRIGDPLSVPDHTSLPEPDIAVVEPGDYLRSHPATARLLIEVAVSSLEVDTKIKPALYAAAAVPEYWVVDVAAKRVHVYREAGPGGYAAETVVGPGDRAEPLHLEVPSVDVGELFRGL